jgi:hypothetical protein
MASAPAPSLEMQGEYNGLVSRMYNYTNGDVAQAQRLAYDAIKSRYGVTTMNGAPEIVKYSPEKFYGLPPQFIRADVADVVKAAGSDVDPAKVRIHATPDVERTKGQRGWLLQTLDEYGNYDTLRDQHNQPVYYDLPLDPAALKAAAEKASAAADVVSNKARAETARTDANAEAVRQQDIAGRTEGRP